MKDFDSTARDQQRALEEMAKRNDHAGMNRVVGQVDDGHVLEMGSRLVVALLANHPAKAQDILRDFEAARHQSHDAVRKVLVRLLTFGSEDGKLALSVTDVMSSLFTELVHTVGAIGERDRAAFEALMDGSVDTAEPIDREAAEERLESLRNCFKVMASVGELVAQGGRCMSPREAGDGYPGSVSLADLPGLAESMGATVEQAMLSRCGHKAPATLGRLLFIGGWIAGTTALVDGESDARTGLDEYLETILKTRD